jgi:hypothetical protein
MSGLLVTATPSLVYAPKEGLKDIAPVIPTTRRVFAPTFKVSGFTRVYQGGKGKVQEVAARLTVRDSGDKVVVEKPLSLPAARFAERAADLNFDVPVADLADGQYLLTVEVGTGATAIRRDSRFRIVK